MAAAKRKPGFNVPCPLCGSTDGLDVTVHNGRLWCGSCAEPIAREHLLRLVADINRLMAWLARAGE